MCCPKRKLWIVMLLALLLSVTQLQAQTSSSGLVSGTVYDKTGAVVPNATVELKNPATNLTYTQTTNDGGQFIFPTVAPEDYKVTVSKEGFRTWSTTLTVVVAKSHPVNPTLEIGEKNEVIEVQAVTGAELQTTDATVGNAIGGDELKYLPMPTRSVSSVLTLQPLVQPMTAGIGTDSGGQVAGARSDQSTFLIDGGDATSDTEASGGYNTQFAGEIRPIVPVPAESVEELRVGTTNPNATFGRSQGGQVVMVTKHGTNSLHGSAYWYHQNTALNANSWTLNKAGRKRPPLIDNRYGGSLGGPIRRDRLFFYGHYEGRRFLQTTTFSRTVPTTLFRQGIMQFRNAAGTVVQYNFNPANGPLTTACVTASNPTGACDPRGIGVSRVTLADMALLPAGDPTLGLGDRLNTIGYTNSVSTGITDEFAVVRLDYNVNKNWNLYVSGRYNYFLQPGAQQIDIVGISGCNAPCATRRNPLQPRYYVVGLNGQITPHLTSQTNVSWYRHWWEWATTPPKSQVSGTAAALSLAGEGPGTSPTKFADPYNIDTQRARSRVWNGKDTYIIENLTYSRGNHTWQFGGSYRFQNIFHQRTDKVTGGLALAPIFYLNAGSFFQVASDFRPAALTSSGDRSRWNNFYAALMGIPDRSAQLLARDGDLNPLPLGTPLQAQVHIHAVEGYVQDIWRLKPSLTLTLGLTYQVQRPPTEEKGRQMVPIYAASGQPVDLNSYFAARREAALKGNILNPDFAFSPVHHVAGNSYVINHIDWNNFGPRLAFAWHPSSSLYGIGGGRTVIRGGWSVTHTRMNGVGLVMTPLLGVGLGQILSCTGPRSNGTCSSGSNPTNAFRVGVDGSGSTILPSTVNPGPPLIPFPAAAPYGETRAFMIDPGFSLGFAHSFDLTLQRELPWNLLVETGYVGRLGRDLVQNWDVNASPYTMLDPVSRQTLASAFDAIAEGVRNGTPITLQPWFENMAGTACTANTTCRSFPSVTAYIVNQFNSEAGISDLWSVMNAPGTGINVLRFRAGQQSTDNLQVLTNNWTTHNGMSDYHAGFVSLQKRMSHGLTFSGNYTYSHSIDLFGINQENTSFSPATPFNPEFDRGPSVFDRRHVFNFYWYQELPLGKGHRFATSNGFIDRVIGDWHWAGIWTYASGFPLCISGGGSNYGSPNPQNDCMLPNSSFANPGASVYHGVAGRSGVGTAGSDNIFADPLAVSNMFRYPLLSKDARFGFGALRGLPSWQLDVSVGKITRITERVALGFTADFLNVFNHPVFKDPGDGTIDFTNSAAFGVITAQRNNPRFIQLGFRVEF